MAFPARERAKALASSPGRPAVGCRATARTYGGQPGRVSKCGPICSDARRVEAIGRCCCCPTTFGNHSIKRRTLVGNIETVMQDPRLEWPDTFAFSADGRTLYVTNSAIYKTPTWSRGVGQQDHIFKMAVGE